MSRLSKLPLILPSEVKVEIDKIVISIKGPKGSLTKTFPNCINILNESNKLHLELIDNLKNNIPYLGLTYSRIKNMIIGVSQGFCKKLQMVGIGYKANFENSILTLNVGYSHPIKLNIPHEINLKVDNYTNINIEGIDKELVGNIASQIRNIKIPEPYKGKGIRYINEIINYKAGKSGKK